MWWKPHPPERSSRRVALLAGVPESALPQAYKQRLQLYPGVDVFVHACRQAGLKTLLVSGGFTDCNGRWKS